MDKELENSINRTIVLGMQQISMLFVERQIARSKQVGEINDNQYRIYRDVADKHWDKWFRKVKKHARNISSCKRRG